VTYFGDSFNWGKGHFVIARDQEPAELFLALAICIFLLQTIQKLILKGYVDLHHSEPQSGKLETPL